MNPMKATQGIPWLKVSVSQRLVERSAWTRPGKHVSVDDLQQGVEQKAGSTRMLACTCLQQPAYLVDLAHEGYGPF